MPKKFSLASCGNENIRIETIKKADKEGIIKSYDAWNEKYDITLNLGFSAKSVWICDIFEEKIDKISELDKVTFPVSNYEIVTLYVEV